jgi:MoxR-like ATPase
MLMRAAKVAAWLNGRDSVVPEDIHAIFREVIAHRIFFTPVYELRRSQVADALIGQLIDHIAAP